MKKFETFAIKRSSYKEMYLLVPHPFTLDIYDIIEEFNEFNKEINKGTILIDLESIIGNRKENFVLFNIIDFKLKRSTLQEYTNATDELINFKIKYYSTLDKKIIKHLFPVELRYKLLKSSV